MKGRADLHAVRRILALLLVCTARELRSFLSGGDTLKLQTISAKPKEKKNERDGERSLCLEPNSFLCLCTCMSVLYVSGQGCVPACVCVCLHV